MNHRSAKYSNTDWRRETLPIYIALFPDEVSHWVFSFLFSWPKLICIFQSPTYLWILNSISYFLVEKFHYSLWWYIFHPHLSLPCSFSLHSFFYWCLIYFPSEILYRRMAQFPRLLNSIWERTRIGTIFSFILGVFIIRGKYLPKWVMHEIMFFWFTNEINCSRIESFSLMKFYWGKFSEVAHSSDFCFIPDFMDIILNWK